jgi:hypothetical protein
MKQGGTRGQTEGATMEEARLKRALDDARENFVREARAATNITLSLRKGVRVGKVFNLKRGTDRTRLDAYIAQNPHAPVAIAKTAYDKAYSEWKEYLYAHKHKDEADREVRNEVMRVITERRMSALQATFGRFFKEHPKIAIPLALALMLVVGLTVVKIGGVMAATAAIGTALGIRLGGGYAARGVYAFLNRHKDPEAIGAHLANIQYSTNWLSFISALVVGFYVRFVGAEQALTSFGYTADEARGIADTRVGAAIGTDQIIAPAEAAPRGPQTGPEGVITPDEQAFIKKTLAPFERIADQYDARIKALEAQREDFIRRAMAAGRPRHEAEYYFDANLEILRDVARAYRNLINSTRGQLEYVARWPFRPDAPNALVDEAHLRTATLSQGTGQLEDQYRQFAGTVERGRIPVFVESSLQKPQGGTTPVSYELTGDTNQNPSEGAVEVPVAGGEAINALWEMARPAFEGYNKISNMITLLDPVEPEFGTPEHIEWYNLRNQLVDAQTAYRDVLHGYARLQSVLGELSVKNPSLSSSELISLIQNDQESARGLKTLVSLRRGIEPTANELIDRARSAYNLPEPSASPTESPEGSLAPTEEPGVQGQGEIIEVAYGDNVPNFSDPTQCQEYIFKMGDRAKRMLLEYLQSLPEPKPNASNVELVAYNQRKQAILAAIKHIDDIVHQRTSDAVDYDGYRDAAQGPNNLRDLATLAKMEIERTLAQIFPRGRPFVV